MNNTAAKNLVLPLTYINIARSTMVVFLTTLFIAEGKKKKEESRKQKEEGRRKKEEGRRKKEESRRKKAEERKQKKEEKCSSNILSFPQFDALSANHLVDCYLTKLR